LTVDGGRLTVGWRNLYVRIFSSLNLGEMGKFKDLRVWNDGMELAEKIYAITKLPAFSKDFALTNQITRACISVPSNIAEGDERGTNREAVHFFNIAKGSAAEIITQLNPCPSHWIY